MSRSAELVPLGDGVFYVPGNPNSGVIVSDGSALLVDAGGDRDRGKALARAVRESGHELVGILLTHSHADHIGGCAAIVKETGAPVYVSAVESAFVEHTTLETCMLLSGAAPWTEMQGKFLMAQPAPVAGRFVDGPMSVGGVEFAVYSLPGHSPGSVGIAAGAVLFAGDAVFAPEVLGKFIVPYNTNMTALMASHARLKELAFDIVVPGHGVPGGTDLADKNLGIAEATIESVLAALVEGPAGSQEIVDRLCRAAGGNARIPNPGVYYLYHAGVLACLSHLFGKGAVRTMIDGGRLLWERVG
ncbi:MAG: MBL fold metallo-hydrolase [Clostridia bacterium]|nr:MBL fold metallo-hydrolase [Clostridia bacterium]